MLTPGKLIDALLPHGAVFIDKTPVVASNEPEVVVTFIKQTTGRYRYIFYKGELIRITKKLPDTEIKIVWDKVLPWYEDRRLVLLGIINDYLWEYVNKDQYKMTVTQFEYDASCDCASIDIKIDFPKRLTSATIPFFIPKEGDIQIDIAIDPNRLSLDNFWIALGILMGPWRCVHCGEPTGDPNKECYRCRHRKNE